LKSAEAAAPLIGAAAVLIAWQASVILGHIPAVLLPSPGAVVSRLFDEWPRLWADAGVTCGEALAAFAFAVTAGVGIAMLMTLRPGARQALQPHLVLFQLVPKVALGPLFITWFGLGWSSRIAFAMFVSVFPVAIGALTGFSRVDPAALRLLLACRATRWQVFRHLRLPGAASYIFAGTKVAATMAFTGATVGEFLSAQSGLGYAILNAASVSDTPLIFAALLLLCALGAALYGGVVAVEAGVRRAMAAGPS
jgi:NitT/TauT family transport system permease protein